MRYFILFTLLTQLAQCSIPSNFKRCLRKDPNFKKCYNQAAQFAVTQLTKPYKVLDLPNLEPLHIPSLTVADKGGAVAVNQNFKNCTLHGLSTSKLDIFELDLEKKMLNADTVTPELVFKCHYELDGKVLLLPIKGEGNSILTFTNFNCKYQIFFDEVVRNNKTYYTTVRSEMQSKVEHAHFQFDNLFDGNKELGDNINLVLNDNWKEITDELLPEYNEIVRQILVEIMEKSWKKVSLEELFD